MSWQMALVGAIGAAGFQQAGKLGKYNQSVFNRNADIKEQSNQILDSKLDLDLARFDQELKKLISSQKVTTAASGAVIGTGTAKKIELSTLYKAEVDKDIANYNNEIAKARNLEAANLDRIQGQLARQRAKLQQFQIATQAGTSLLTMTG